jgi:hypothetical protein
MTRILFSGAWGKKILEKKRGFRIRIHLIRIPIRIQHFRLNTDPDPDPILSQCFMTKTCKKFTAENFFLKTKIFLSLELHKGRPCYNNSLQYSKENI